MTTNNNSTIPTPTDNMATSNNNIPSTTTDDNIELLTIKLNRKKEKAARFESHHHFLNTCLKDNVIPRNFRMPSRISIGNHDEAFCASWHAKTLKLSRELIQDTISFCNTTITEVKEEIDLLQNTIKQRMNEEEFRAIDDTISLHINSVTSQLERTKNRKFELLKSNSSMTPSRTGHRKRGRPEKHNINSAGTDNSQRNTKNKKLIPPSPVNMNNTDTEELKYTQQVPPPPKNSTSSAHTSTGVPRRRTNSSYNRKRTTPITAPPQDWTATRDTHTDPTTQSEQGPPKNEVSPLPATNVGGIENLIPVLLKSLDALRCHLGSQSALGTTLMGESTTSVLINSKGTHSDC